MRKEPPVTAKLQLRSGKSITVPVLAVDLIPHAIEAAADPQQAEIDYKNAKLVGVYVKNEIVFDVKTSKTTYTRIEEVLQFRK